MLTSSILLFARSCFVNDDRPPSSTPHPRNLMAIRDLRFSLSLSPLSRPLFPRLFVDLFKRARAPCSFLVGTRRTRRHDYCYQLLHDRSTEELDGEKEISRAFYRGIALNRQAIVNSDEKSFKRGMRDDIVRMHLIGKSCILDLKGFKYF